jgi:hypothetical protein
MSNNPILTRFGTGISRFHWLQHPKPDLPRPNLHDLYAHPQLLPEKVVASPEALHCLNLLGPLDWSAFPERDLQRDWGQETTPYSAFAATCLFKIDQQMFSFSHLAGYLADHPEMAWLLGFPSINAVGETFQPDLPSARHFPRLLHKMPNACPQFLLDSSVKALLAEFQRRGIAISETVSLDTKHILAWSRRTIPKPISRAIASTKRNSHQVILTANWAANAVIISALPARNRPPHQPVTLFRQTPFQWANSTGAMLPVWSPARFLIGVNLCWPK